VLTGRSEVIDGQTVIVDTGVNSYGQGTKYVTVPNTITSPQTTTHTQSGNHFTTTYIPYSSGIETKQTETEYTSHGSNTYHTTTLPNSQVSSSTSGT